MAYDPRTDGSQLYLLHKPGYTSGARGQFEFVDGYSGPYPKHVARQGVGRTGAKMVEIGSTRDVLVTLGVIETNPPPTPSDTTEMDPKNLPDDIVNPDGYYKSGDTDRARLPEERVPAGEPLYPLVEGAEFEPHFTDDDIYAGDQAVNAAVASTESPAEAIEQAKDTADFVPENAEFLTVKEGEVDDAPDPVEVAEDLLSGDADIPDDRMSAVGTVRPASELPWSELQKVVYGFKVLEENAWDWNEKEKYEGRLNREEAEALYAEGAKRGLIV